MKESSRKSKSLVPPGLDFIAENITSRGNILGASRKDRAKWAERLKLPRDKETIFFAGCGYQFTSSLETMMTVIRKTDTSAIGSDFVMNVASIFQKKLGIDGGQILHKLSGGGTDDDAVPLVNAVSVLMKLNIDFGYMADEEPCCGGLLYYAGKQASFADNSRKVYRIFKERGIKRIIGIVPSCTYTLKTLATDYSDGYSIDVKHFSEIIAQNLPSLKMELPQSVKVAYHDPCQLSRYMGITDEPRRILRAIRGVELVEPDWTKNEWSTCCGGGGGFEAVYPELSGILAAKRASELVETDADIIVTSCPGCIMQLKDGLKHIKADAVKVLDLAEIVAQGMEV